MVEALAPVAGFLLVAGLLAGLVDPFFAGVFVAVVSRETSGIKAPKPRPRLCRFAI